MAQALLPVLLALIGAQSDVADARHRRGTIHRARLPLRRESLFVAVAFVGAQHAVPGKRAWQRAAHSSRFGRPMERTFCLRSSIGTPLHRPLVPRLP